VNLLRADPGFRPQQVLTASILLPVEQYRDPARRIQFFEKLVAALESQPGVQSAGVGSDLPWTGYDGNADGYRIETHPDARTMARYHTASPDYFRALGVPLVRGRFLSVRDTSGSPAVIVVNESMANRYWHGEDAVGKRIAFSSQPTETDWIRIVGVVKDVKDQPDSSWVRPAFWLAYAQEPDRDMSVVVRSTSPPAVASAQLRQAVRQLNPDLAIADLRFMDQIADAAFSSQRFALFLVALFAALALVLATFGMCGVISYSVNQRMGEFGLRMALGARPWDLMRLIVGRGLALAAVGAALGIACALALGRLLANLLYGVRAADPVTLAAVALLELITATIACVLPARRATGADPLRSLRSE
jgi:predicted permease